MELNYTSAEQNKLLPQALLAKGEAPYPILHFGVGGFHRSHQAWALQQLMNRQPEKYAQWGITGVGLLPYDIAFTKAFRAQDCFYFVQRFAPEGEQKTELIAAIKEILHASEDYQTILERIASRGTRIISFTITEGGYNVDYSNNTFIWDTPAVQSDLKKEGGPKTVYRVLAEGLKKRIEANAGPVVLMSCDNVQHNGDILKLALLEFLKQFDPSIIEWVETNVAFIKTMVDRITPATTQKQKEDFAKTQSITDNCLIVCEEYFQWIIEQHPAIAEFPLKEMGAILVKDVDPYEKMKLRLLNGGHSLTGLLGYALGYNTIHTAIKDDGINKVFQRYCAGEVIPTLDTLEAVHYPEYVQDLISRFGNPMINDSTARIISGSTDKLPKFVLPVITDLLKKDPSRIRFGVLILAGYYHYLKTEFEKDQMAAVIDLNRDKLRGFFGEAGWDAEQFISRVPMLQPVKQEATVRNLFLEFVKDLQEQGMRFLINKLLQGDAQDEK